MIKITNGGPKDLLPPIIKNDPDMQAYSYAIEQAVKVLLELSSRTRMYAAIDEQPENILDYMATEIRAQYYEESMDIATKREIIKNALAWYMKAGTQEAVDELIQTAFGEGKTIPWYENGGDPGTFEVEVPSLLDQKGYETFARLINTTKNASAHLKNIRSISTAKGIAQFGTLLEQDSAEAMRNDRTGEKETYIQKNVLLACIGEIYEQNEGLFVRKLEADLKKCTPAAGTIMQSILTADLYEFQEKQERISTEERSGTVLSYIHSSAL